MKSQGLPLSTIVILVLVILVLVAVTLFFYGTFEEGKEGVGEHTIIARCHTACTRIQTSGEIRIDGTFCDLECYDYISCSHPDKDRDVNEGDCSN